MTEFEEYLGYKLFEKALEEANKDPKEYDDIKEYNIKQDNKKNDDKCCN